jgi:hypothetical protein
MRKLFWLFAVTGVVCLWSAGAAAQTKVGWSDSCAKGDPDYMVQVGDRPGHGMGLFQTKCHSTKPAEISGDKAKEGVATATMEVNGNTAHERGTYVLSMENGDKVAMPFQATIAMKDGKPAGVQGTWTFGAGTGKLKGVKGKGTFHCSPEGEGWNCSGEGEYEAAK